MHSSFEPTGLPAETSGAGVSSGKAVRLFNLRMQGVLTLLVTGLTLWTFGRFRMSLLWGGILAIICWPLFERLRRKWSGKHAQTLLPAAIVAGIALIFIVPAIFLVSTLTREARAGAQWVTEVSKNGLPVPGWVNHLPFSASAVDRWWQANLADPEKLHGLIRHLKTEQALGTAERLGHDAINTVVIAGFALLILFFLLRAGNEVIVRIDRLGHRLFGHRSALMIRHVVGAVRGTMAGLVLVGLGEGALITAAYMIAGAPQALLLGIFTSCAAMIPLVGGFALAFCVVIILIKGSLTAASCVGIFGTLILFLGDHFVRPVLIGGSIHLPFMWVLLGILGGLETWGIEGLFIGPVLTALAHLAWQLGSGRSVAGATHTA